MNVKYRMFFPLVLTFSLFTLILLIAKLFFDNNGIDFIVILIANALFFLMSILVFRMQRKAMQHSNPNVFIRSVMAGMMIKMFIVIVAVMAYVLLSGKNFNKPAIFISLLLYLVYLAVEVAAVMKLNKRKNA